MNDISVNQGVTIIVPLLNEQAVVPSLIQQLAGLDAEQIIIVDGGSVDRTRELVEAAGYTVIQSPAGRARQMNAGAQQATQTMLLFLHADTRLPRNYKLELARADVWGRFDVQFSSSLRIMNMVAFFINLRSRISGVATGDQAIFIDRDAFHAIGGFPDFPIMEDVALCKRLRYMHRPFSSRARVVTSARRWEQNGVASTIVKMWWYRLAYFFGVSPLKLKQGYRDVR
ncbi:MAG: rSAM/selenodomain-associated transferase 2 [Arenicella sp.]